MALVSQDDVLEARHFLDQHEVLVNHSDAVLNGNAGACDVHLLTVHEDLALGRLVQADKDVHERRLASAVLAQQGVDLAFPHGQVHVLVGVERAKALADVFHPQQF